MTATSRPPLPPWMRDILHSKRLQHVRAFAAEHSGRSLRASEATDKRSFGVLSPEPDRSGRWRISRFDRRGPIGHSTFASYLDAVRDLDRDYDLSAAAFAPEATRRASCGADVRSAWGAVRPCELITNHDGEHKHGEIPAGDSTAADLGGSGGARGSNQPRSDYGSGNHRCAHDHQTGPLRQLRPGISPVL